MGRREELGRLDESDLFMELIRDVANELDINVLCHKILVNVGLLTHADRGSLFLAKGPLEDRYLVAKLFDVTQDTELEEALQRAKNEEIKIPFGIGIAGYVAQTKEIINIKDAYKVSPIYTFSLEGGGGREGRGCAIDSHRAARLRTLNPLPK